MAFELPFPPFPHDSRDVPFIATPDDNNGYAVPSSQYFKKLVGERYLWTPVSSTDPLPSSDAAAQAKLADILTKLSADPATQTTLAQILAKIIAAPATEAKQTALNALIGEVQAAPTANTLLARLKSLEDKIAAIIAGTSPAVTTLSGSNTKSIKIANAVAIADAIGHTYNLINHGGISLEEIQRYRKAVVYVQDSHNKVGALSIYRANIAAGSTTMDSTMAIYLNNTEITTNVDRFIYSASAVGTGGSNTQKAIAALNDPFVNLFVKIIFSEAPTSGSLTIIVELSM